MIIDSHRLTAGAFADKIGVQRSNVSHVLSGRNKPSFEFLEKVLLAFPKVSALWLVTGRQERGDAESALDPKSNLAGKEVETTVSKAIKLTNSERKLVKTLLIYNDNSCEEYLNRQ